MVVLVVVVVMMTVVALVSAAGGGGDRWTWVLGLLSDFDQKTPRRFYDWGAQRYKVQGTRLLLFQLLSLALSILTSTSQPGSSSRLLPPSHR